MRLVQVFLHNGYTHGELEECYKVSAEDADTLYNTLYEIELWVDLDTRKIYTEKPQEG